MNSFNRFRQHVQDQPDAVAVVTPYRTATYRKMWSRIERSTARLQGEWNIKPGDTIAYVGCGHLDALVMYLAAARCGARLLPLEHVGLQHAAPAITAAAGVVLVLHDDALAPTIGLAAGIACRPLSTLIATICQHREQVTEDSSAVSLLQWLDPTPVQYDVPDVMHRLQGCSLDQLTVQASLADSTAPRTVNGALFDKDIFGPLVLATVLAGRALRFGAA